MCVSICIFTQHTLAHTQASRRCVYSQKAREKHREEEKKTPIARCLQNVHNNTTSSCVGHTLQMKTKTSVRRRRVPAMCAARVVCACVCMCDKVYIYILYGSQLRCAPRDAHEKKNNIERNTTTQSTTSNPFGVHRNPNVECFCFVVSYALWPCKCAK